MSRGNRGIATAAAAALLAVALSACGTVSGAPPAETTGAATAAPATAKWISLPPSPVPPAEQDAAHQLRFGPTSVGVGIYERGTDTGCTLGPVAAPDMSPKSRGYVTAAHCDTPATEQVVAYSDAAHTASSAMGVYTPSQPGLDATTVWSDTTPAATIAGRPVAGVLTEATVKDPALAMQPVCILGAASGLVCGPLVDTSDGIAVDARTAGGDSGAPIFLVSEASPVTLIGVLTQSSPGGTTYGIALDPALRSLGSRVVTDPSVAVDPAVDSWYSDRVVETS